jgi:anti-sigma factor RsiW
MNRSDENIFDLVTPFVDGELPESVAREVAREIEANPMYQRLVAAERATKHAIRTLTARHAAPAQFQARVRTAIFGTADSPAADPRPARVPLWRLLTRSPAYASAVGALALGVALVVVITLFSGHRITPFVEDVYAHHVEEQRFPVQIEGNYESVAEQTGKEVGFRVPVPRLGDQLALQGARKCYLCGHLMAFIKYTGQEGLISLFVIPKTRLAMWRLEKRTHDGMVFYAVRHKDLEIVFWRKGGVCYAMAGTVGKDRLVDLACKACCQVREANGPATARPCVHPVLVAGTAR